MKKYLCASTIAACAALCGAASAAPVYNWTGYYVGVHAGGAFGTSTWTNIVVPEDSGQNIPGKIATNHPTGGFGGVQGGYNMQQGHWVWGGEVALSGASLTGEAGCIGNYGDFHAQCRSGANFMGDVAGRLGYAWGQSLVYLKAGGAFANTQFVPASESKVFSDENRVAPGYKTSDQMRWAPLIGVGVEYAFKKHWSVGAEFDYADFSKKTVTMNPNPGNASTANYLSPVFKVDTTEDINSFEVRLNYHF